MKIQVFQVLYAFTLFQDSSFSRFKCFKIQVFQLLSFQPVSAASGASSFLEKFLPQVPCTSFLHKFMSSTLLCLQHSYVFNILMSSHSRFQLSFKIQVFSSFSRFSTFKFFNFFNFSTFQVLKFFNIQVFQVLQFFHIEVFQLIHHSSFSKFSSFSTFTLFKFSRFSSFSRFTFFDFFTFLTFTFFQAYKKTSRKT